MAKKIKIRKVSAWTMGITVVLAIMFAIISYKSEKEFRTLRMTTEQYIACEKAAKQLQNGSAYLTEQVRLYAITGKASIWICILQKRIAIAGKMQWKA